MNKINRTEDFLALFKEPQAVATNIGCAHSEEAPTVGEDLGMSFNEFFSRYADDEDEGN